MNLRGWPPCCLWKIPWLACFTGVAILFIFLDLGFEFAVLLGQIRLLFRRLLPRLLQRAFFSRNACHARKTFQQRVRLIILFVRIHRRAHDRVRAVIACFVLGLQSLDLRLRIAAGLLEIFVGVVEFVLIEIDLGLGDVDLVLQVVLLRFGGGREFPGQRVTLS